MYAGFSESETIQWVTGSRTGKIFRPIASAAASRWLDISCSQSRDKLQASSANEIAAHILATDRLEGLLSGLLDRARNKTAVNEAKAKGLRKKLR